MDRIVIIDNANSKISFCNENLNGIETIPFKFELKRIKKIQEIIKTNSKIALKIEDLSENNIDLLEYALKALIMDDDKLKYEFIYDTICQKLDEDFAKNDYCKFENDRCIAQRENKTAHEIMGCCYEFRYSRFLKLPIEKGLCHFIQNKRCSQNCLTCKMFTCKYLKSKGIKFTLDDFWPLNTFFNEKQKEILSESFFKSKEEILDSILKAK